MFHSLQLCAAQLVFSPEVLGLLFGCSRGGRWIFGFVLFGVLG